MEQISRECKVGLVSYTITHHTRQSAIGLPFISRKNFDGKEMAVTEYTMSEIVASIYEKIQESGLGRNLFIDEINCVPRHWHLPCCSSFSVKPLEATRFRKAG